MQRTETAAIAGAIAAAFFFGVSTPLSKALAGDLNAFELAGLLYLGAGAGLAALEPLKSRRPAPEGRKLNYKYIIGMVLFGVLLSVVALGESLSVIQMVSGALLFASVWLMLAEKHRHAHGHIAMEHTHRHGHDDLHHAHRHPDGDAGPHSHFHAHAKSEHDHPHRPDLHHRHNH